MAWRPELERVFHPEAVAVVGASKTADTNMQGGGFIRNFQRLGFEGRIYPVNPRLKEILGLKVYPDLASVPEHLDLVIVSTPAAEVPAVLEDCIVAGAKNVQDLVTTTEYYSRLAFACNHCPKKRIGPPDDGPILVLEDVRLDRAPPAAATHRHVSFLKAHLKLSTPSPSFRHIIQ